MTFISRGAIGLKPPRSTQSWARKDGICFHHAGGRLGIERHDQCISAWKKWQKQHMAPGGLGTKNGAADLAYNLGACEHGWVLEGRGLRVRTGGNGTGDANSRFLAIVYIGGLGDDVPPLGWSALREAAEMGVSAGFPRRGYGHQDFKATACPGPVIYPRRHELVAPLPVTPIVVPTVQEASEMIKNPAVAMEVTPSGQGYYVLASDGAVFAFGDAPYHGGRGGLATENAPFTGMRLVVKDGKVTGYYLLGADGGIFAYGDALYIDNPVKHLAS